MTRTETVRHIRKQIKARVERHRDAKREAGLAQLHNLWAHPADHEKLRRIAARMAARRGIQA